MRTVSFALFFVSVLASAQPAISAAPSPETLEILAGMEKYYVYATPEQIKKHVKGIHLGKAAYVMENGENITPLMRAAQETPHPEVIDILMRAGSDIDAVSYPREERENPGTPYKRTAVNFAVENPDPEILKALLAYKPRLDVLHAAENNRSPLREAAGAKERSEHFFLLLEAGATPRPNELANDSLWDFLRVESVWDKTSGSRCQVPATDAQTAAKMTGALLPITQLPQPGVFRNALQGGYSDAAILLIEAGALDSGWEKARFTPLYHALHRGDPAHEIPDPSPELLRLLLRRYDVNAQTLTGVDPVEPGSAQDYSPFALACRSAMGVDLVRLLVESGANVDPTRNDLLVESLGTLRDNPELTAYLLELGFSPTREAQYKGAPLDAVSASRFKPESIKVLLRAGADPARLSFDPRMTSTHDLALVEAGIFDKDGTLLISRGESEIDRARNAADAEALLEAARLDPERYLYSRELYRIATPEQLGEIIGNRSLSRVRTTRVYTRRAEGVGPGAMVGNMIGIFRSDTTSQVKKDTPLMYAASVTPYPEVIDVLVEAGDRVTNLESAALTAAVRNPDHRVLERVLHYKPDLEAPMYDRGTPLHYLAWVDDTTPEHLRVLLEAGADVNARDSGGYTPLMGAIRWQREDRARLFIRAGADVNAVAEDGTTALALAVANKAFDLAGDLVRAGAIDVPVPGWNSALVAAAGEPECGEELLLLLLKQAGADSEQAAQALLRAALRANLKGYALLRENGVPFNKEHMESAAGELVYSGKNSPASVAMLSRLLAEGVSPNGQNRFGHSFLMSSLEYTQADTAIALIRAGADVNERDGNGYTPLLAVLATERAGPEELDRRRAAIVRALLDAGADVNAETNEGWNALQLGMNKPGMPEMLVHAGADVNAMGGNGWRPLALAAANPYYTDAIIPLLKAGADPNLKTRWGSTAVATAIKKKSGKALSLLEQGMAGAL